MAILVTKVFKALIAIITAFNLNLDIWQSNIINIFANSLINKIVYIKCLDKFTIKSKYLILYRALYRL